MRGADDKRGSAFELLIRLLDKYFLPFVRKIYLGGKKGHEIEHLKFCSPPLPAFRACRLGLGSRL